jgi:hypothetical protein
MILHRFIILTGVLAGVFTGRSRGIHPGTPPNNEITDNRYRRNGARLAKIHEVDEETSQREANTRRISSPPTYFINPP